MFVYVYLCTIDCVSCCCWRQYNKPTVRSPSSSTSYAATTENEMCTNNDNYDRYGMRTHTQATSDRIECMFVCLHTSQSKIWDDMVVAATCTRSRFVCQSSSLSSSSHLQWSSSDCVIRHAFKHTQQNCAFSNSFCHGTTASNKSSHQNAKPQ